MVLKQQEVDNLKQVLKTKQLAEKKMWKSSLIGSLSGGFGAYIYCGRYCQILSGLLLSMMIGCVAAPALTQEYCEDNGYGVECGYFINLAPIFFFVAMIDNASAIASAREKLKQIEETGTLPEDVEPVKTRFQDKDRIYLIPSLKERIKGEIRVIILKFNRFYLSTAKNSLVKYSILALSSFVVVIWLFG